MTTQVNEFYNLSNFVNPTPDITQDGYSALSAPEVVDAVPAETMPVATPVPVMNVCVYYRDMYTTPESYDKTCDQFKMDISFIVTVFDENNKELESGVVTKRLILSKQCLAEELACNTPVTEELDLTKKVIAAAKEVKEAVIESATDAHQKNLKRMRELAGIPHHTNRV